MVVSFRSSPELVEAVYDVLRKYLECAVGESSRMQAAAAAATPLLLRPKAKASRGGLGRVRSEEVELQGGSSMDSGHFSGRYWGHFSGHFWADLQDTIQ